MGGNSNFFAAECETFGFFVSSLDGRFVRTWFSKQAAFLLALSVSSTIGFAESSKSGLTILRSDTRSLVLEYTPRYTPPREIESGNSRFSLFDFSESVPAQNSESVGSPDLRFGYFPVGFPSIQGNVVQVIAADYEDVPNVLLAPVPTVTIKDEFVESEVYTMSPERYQVSGFQPSKVVELSPVSRSRSHLIGGVKIFPIQYNPASNTVRRYSKIVIEIIFGSFGGQRSPVHDELFSGDAVINGNVAKSWTLSPPQTSTIVPTPSVLALGNWYRLTVSDEGVFRLDAQYLTSAGINLQGVNPQTVKIYGNGGREITENVNAARPNDLVENAIYVEGEGDGQFNADDYVLFYGKGVRGWEYNRSSKILNHYINHYSEVNYYWLTFGGAPGRRMEVQPSLSGPATVVPDRFRDGVVVEEEKVNFLNSGKEWYGQTILPGGSFTHANSLPGLVPNDLILYRYSALARSSTTPSFTIRESSTGSVLETIYFFTVSYDGDGFYADERISQSYGTSSLPNNQSAVTFAYSGNVAASGWINWLEVQYPRTFAAANNYLRFRSPDTTGTVEYRLEQFASSPFIFNVTKQDSVRRITGAVGSYTFRAAEVAGQVSDYCATAGSFKIPTAIQLIPAQDLHGYAPADSVDFIIVTSKEFRSAADRLKAYREQPAHGNLRTLVVEVDTIYNEFGGGIPDVTAIRDFLKYSYNKWTPRLRFVLFFGQASYDYKGLLGSRSSYVPTWQGANSLHTISSYSSDDYFARFDFVNDYVGTRPWLVTGRISSRQVSEANLVVDKLIGYEDHSARDPWKMRMVYVGDDGWTPGGDEGTQHSQQAEDLSRFYTPNEFEKKKIYIAEYPTVTTAQGRRKPSAYQAIIEAINRGALVVNFTGHGNPTVWTHESVFSTQTSIPLLTNADKLCVYFGATCNFSQMDDPKRYTGSELLINKPNGGAIAVVSATRKVFGSPNAFLNQQTFARMFARTPSGRLIVERPATALFRFKTGGNSDNDQKFFFMGDPTMRLQFPEGFALVDSINQLPVDSVNGVPRTAPIQLQALSQVTVKGTILTQANRPDSTLQGRMSLAINDATQSVVIVNFSPGLNWSYLATGGAIYRGENSITNGRFSAEFIVPKDILYADSTSRGRVVAYYSSATTNGMGYTEKVWIGGTADSAGHDEQGPGIDIYLDSRSFRSGDLVSRSPMLYVDLEDQNGINTSGSGIGHRIEAWLNNATQSIDLTDFYSSELDNFRKGTVQYPLTDLRLGKNSLRVRAWDTYNNATSGETFFEVTSSDKLSIADVMNYPNPFAKTTAFTFRQNQLVPLDVTIKIYTLAGRLIQTLETVSPGEPFVSLPWDGRDRDGDILANGVYLYKVLVKTRDGRFSSEALGKLSVVK